MDLKNLTFDAVNEELRKIAPEARHSIFEQCNAILRSDVARDMMMKGDFNTAILAAYLAGRASVDK